MERDSTEDRIQRVCRPKNLHSLHIQCFGDIRLFHRSHYLYGPSTFTRTLINTVREYLSEKPTVHSLERAENGIGLGVQGGGGGDLVLKI